MEISQSIPAAYLVPLVNGEASDRRWMTQIKYRSSTTPGGIVTHTHFFEEMDELIDIVEDGFHWGTIASMEIFLNRVDPEQKELTIERAAEL